MSCHEIVPLQNAFCTALISSLLFVPAAVEHPVLPSTSQTTFLNGNDSVSSGVEPMNTTFLNGNDSVSSDVESMNTTFLNGNDSVSSVQVYQHECLNLIEVMKNQSDPAMTMKLEIRPFAGPSDVRPGYIVPMHELKCSMTVMNDQCLSYNFKWNFDCYDDAFQLVFRTKEAEDVLHLVRKNCDEKYSICEIKEVRDFLFQDEWVGCNTMVTCCGCVYSASTSSNDLIESSGNVVYGRKCVELGCKSQFINRPIGTQTMKLKHVPFFWVVYLLAACLGVTLLALAIIGLMSMEIRHRHKENVHGGVEEEGHEEDLATSFNSVLVSFQESYLEEADNISSASTR